MTDTLVLDINWQPVGRISWQRAITQYFKSRIEIIDSYEDRDIRSVTFSMKMPSIVRELSRYRRKNAVKFSRENVYARDKGMCQYCRKKISRAIATYDHVVPKGSGGKTKWENIVIACFECNQRKRDRTPDQAGMKLMQKPEKPKSLPNNIRLTFVWHKGMPESWKNFLTDVSYWHGELESEE